MSDSHETIYKHIPEWKGFPLQLYEALARRGLMLECSSIYDASSSTMKCRAEVHIITNTYFDPQTKAVLYVMTDDVAKVIHFDPAVAIVTAVAEAMKHFEGDPEWEAYQTKIETGELILFPKPSSPSISPMLSEP